MNTQSRTTRIERDPMYNLERELKIRGFSRKTIKAYLYYNRKFLNFARKSPKEIANEDIKRYLEYLANKKVSNATLSLAINALKFYYTQVLKRKFFFDIKHPKKEKRLPVVLTKDEIKRMLEVTANLKHKLLMEIMYASGLRVSEIIKLKIKDIDLEEGIIRVNLGKGKKDRQTILSKRAIEDLKIYFQKRNDENPYVFPGAQNKGHLSTRSIQKIVLQAAKLADIKKDISCHSLRHSFATHLLEKGVDIRYIQKLLGHKRLETTQIYTKVSTQKLKEIGSPLDDL